MLYEKIVYRGYLVRTEMKPLLTKEKMSMQMIDMMKFYSSKWRSKSIFQVLLRYRAARYQDLVQFSQQVNKIFLIFFLLKLIINNRFLD